MQFQIKCSFKQVANNSRKINSNHSKYLSKRFADKVYTCMTRIVSILLLIYKANNQGTKSSNYLFKSKMAQSTEKKLKKCCYVQPPVRENMKPDRKYQRPTTPFEDETVHRTSYMPIDSELAKLCKLDSMKPNHNVNLNRHLKMDTDTIHNLSYQPVITKPRVIPPWAIKSKFIRPQVPMDLNTIYENSYRLPGTFVECDENADKNVIVTYAEECHDIEGLIRLPDGPHI